VLPRHVQDPYASKAGCTMSGVMWTYVELSHIRRHVAFTLWRFWTASGATVCWGYPTTLLKQNCRLYRKDGMC